MIDRIRHSLLHLLVSAVISSVLGAFIGLATAQEQKPGQLDTICFASCTENGYEEGFCSQVCLVPDPISAGKSEGLDWKCVTASRYARAGHPDRASSSLVWLPLVFSKSALASGKLGDKC